MQVNNGQSVFGQSGEKWTVRFLPCQGKRGQSIFGQSGEKRTVRFWIRQKTDSSFFAGRGNRGTDGVSFSLKVQARALVLLAHAESRYYSRKFIIIR